MNNFRILARNMAEVGEGGTITVSPALETTKPETNLWLPSLERGRTARTTGLTSQGVTRTWAADIKANMVAFARTNWSSSATLRSVIKNSGASTLYDSTALPAWVTSGLDTDVSDYTERRFAGLRNTVHYFTEQTTVRSAEETVADASNADGYMEMTKLFVGKYFELTYNPEGVEVTPGDASISGAAEDGSDIVDVRWRRRTITIQLAAIPNATDLKTLDAICHYLGTERTCWIDLYPHDTTSMGISGRGAFRLADAPALNHAQYGIHRSAFRFIEK